MGNKGKEDTYTVAKLKGTENYKEWAREMGFALQDAGLESYADGTSIKPRLYIESEMYPMAPLLPLSEEKIEKRQAEIDKWVLNNSVLAERLVRCVQGRYSNSSRKPGRPRRYGTIFSLSIRHQVADPKSFSRGQLCIQQKHGWFWIDHENHFSCEKKGHIANHCTEPALIPKDDDQSGKALGSVQLGAITISQLGDLKNLELLDPGVTDQAHNSRDAFINFRPMREEACTATGERIISYGRGDVVKKFTHSDVMFTNVL